MRFWTSWTRPAWTRATIIVLASELCCPRIRPPAPTMTPAMPRPDSTGASTRTAVIGSHTTTPASRMAAARTSAVSFRKSEVDEPVLR
jgi:hypothetical protein